MKDFREEAAEAAVQPTLTLRASLHPRAKRRRRVEEGRAPPVPQAVSVTTRITSPQALPAVVVVGTAALVLATTTATVTQPHPHSCLQPHHIQ